MKKLYATENRVELYLLKSKLEENGIHCNIKNENPPLAGELPPIIAWPELWILNDDQYDAALNILKKETSEISAHTDKWICSQCGTHLEKQFNICWKCGNSR